MNTQPSGGSAEKIRADLLLKILDGVQTQIRFFDTKAQIVLGIDGILAGFVGVQIPALAEVVFKFWPSFLSVWLLIVFCTLLISLMLSLLQALRTIYPRLNIGQPDSKIFFAHLARIYGNDYVRASRELTGLSEQELSVDIANQLLANSRVCELKYARLTQASMWMAVAITSWVVTCVLLFAAKARLVGQAGGGYGLHG